MTEYNPRNEHLKKQYEDTLLHEGYREQRTADAAWKAINLYERFTGKKDLPSISIKQAKAFKLWLVKQENGKGELLSISTVRSTLKNLRSFFDWLSIHPRYIRKVDRRAVGYLRLSNNQERAGRATREMPVPTLEEVHKVLKAMPANTDIERRDRAIIAFMGLAGVRDSALISLRMGDVSRERQEVWQDPKHVKTKNRKGILTDFMPFDPLWLEIVEDWLEHATQELVFKPDDPLFPKQRVVSNPETLKFEVLGLSREHWANTEPVRQIFLQAFPAAGVPYYNPHSIRKMLFVWALENCSQAEFKAISQNLGHDHAMTSYNAYGNLSEHKRRQLVRGIGKGKTEISDVPDEVIMAEMQKRIRR